VNWHKKAPTPIGKEINIYDNLCRVLPYYIAINFEYFELLPIPRKIPSNEDTYILNFKKKIACMKADFLL